MNSLIHFFNSQFFISLVTLAVGSTAIYIYKKQQIDRKRSAANVILNEIKSAEKLFKDAKTKITEAKKNLNISIIPEHHYLMPHESWSEFRHMFINDFRDNQLEAIDAFYHTCQLFDEAVAYSDDTFKADTKEIRVNVHKAIYKCVLEYAERIENAKSETEKNALKQELVAKKNVISGALTNADYMYTYQASKPFKDVEGYIDTLNDNLSLSIVGKKLEKLARGHWWW